MLEKHTQDWINASLKKKILRYLPKHGHLETNIPGLAITRYDYGTVPEKCLCSPMAAVVLQGYKHAFYGERETNYGPGECVTLGIDLPGIFHVSDASREKPFLSLSIRLDNQIITSLLSEAPFLASHPADNPVGVTKASVELLDALNRLVALLDTPEKSVVFVPMLMREIHFYLLEGNLGGALRFFNASGSKGNQIARAIARLREHFAEPLHIEDLARHVNMSPSTFYRSFRTATSLSPLQFQKRLRLYEAQRLMLMEDKDACSSATAVGYESVSQFTREYKRLFGAPPRLDVERKRR